MVNQEVRYHVPTKHVPGDRFVFEPRRDRSPGRPSETHMLLSFLAGSLMFMLLYGF